MNRRDGWLSGLLLLTGAVIGAATTLFVKEHRPKNPSDVLNETKDFFRQHGTVKGAWIDYDLIEYDLFDNKPLAYIGGVTLQGENGLKYYHFASDAITGDVIDYYPIKLTESRV